MDKPEDIVLSEINQSQKDKYMIHVKHLEQSSNP